MPSENRLVSTMYLYLLDIGRKASSVTRLGDLLHFGHPFKAFGNN